ncbi:MAG TPA: hypothetical protein VMT20_30120 [Terriglobia bacterium]|nr:hypothetical protein [Terriglobia bacterium]
MAFSHRPMLAQDVRNAVKAAGAHPILAARYGCRLADLESVWLALLHLDATQCGIFEEERGATRRIAGVGFATFVSDEFVRDMKTPPLRWIAREVIDRILAGESPVLSNREVQEANSSGGLNAAVWQSGIRPEEFSAELANEAITSFMEAHRGFLLKEIITQPDCISSWTGIRNSGFLFFDAANGCYGEYPEECDVMQPYLLGMTQKLAGSTPGAWVSSNFFYRRPRVGFNRSEQRLLSCALAGGTDEELADRLRISISAVKKTWHSIYERVGSSLPELLPQCGTDGDMSERGKGKKQRLVAYLRDHPEELRPVSRRLLKSRVTRVPQGDFGEAD